MTDIVIQAENLGKHYTIDHQAANDRYSTLRDVLVQNARSLWRATTDLVRGRPLILGNELEEVWALKVVSSKIRRGEVVDTGSHPELTGRENIYRERCYTRDAARWDCPQVWRDRKTAAYMK